MSFDKSFLSPKGLLVNDNKNFCCNGPNFSQLQQATQATLNLPYNDDGMRYYVGFTDAGRQELYADMLVPAMDQFYRITNQSMALESGYRSVGYVCDHILELSATAKVDYDEIFDSLKRLYNDESDNDVLRAQVQAKIKERLSKVDSLSTQSTTTTSNLVDAISNVTEAQMLVKRIGEELADQTIIDRLRKCHEGERDAEEAFEDDCNALAILQGIIAKQNMQDDSQASLANLHLAVGAAFDINNDLNALGDYIAENTEPGPGPLLDLDEANLLEMWGNLGVEVQRFKDSYITG